jgi:uncharacterized protein
MGTKTYFSVCSASRKKCSGYLSAIGREILFIEPDYLYLGDDTFMMHPHTELRFINDVMGVGVFATQMIPKGTLLWALDSLDQFLSEAQVNSLDPLRRAEILKYAYRDATGKYILCWDLGRFMNHSSNPNSMSTAYNCDIAIRDIYPGEQITCDYGCLNLDEPFHCLPESGTNRTAILPDDLPRFAEQWDALVATAMVHFDQVEQPLLDILESSVRDRLNQVAAGTLPMDSVLRHYYQRDVAFAIA